MTEKQARGQPHLQNVLFGGAKRRRKRNKKTVTGKDSGGDSSESEEENAVPSKRSAEAIRAVVPRLGQQRLGQADKEQPMPEQIEPSRILEQSMATAEVSCRGRSDSRLMPRGDRWEGERMDKTVD